MTSTGFCLRPEAATRKGWTFETVSVKLAGRKSKKVANNTYLVPVDDNSIALRLHNTNILTWHPDGRIVYNSGGWKTVTTKARMNEYGPLRIYTAAGIWYFCTGWEDYKPAGTAGVYADGMTCHADGTVTGAAPNNKDEKQLRTRIRAYVHDYIEALLAGKVEKPGPGDCFFCGMRTVDGGIPLGEATKDRDHLMSHLDESYFVPSLLVRACEAAGMQPGYWLTWVWGPDAETERAKREAQRNAPHYRRALRRYIYGELGLVK